MCRGRPDETNAAIQACRTSERLQMQTHTLKVEGTHGPLRFLIISRKLSHFTISKPN